MQPWQRPVQPPSTSTGHLGRDGHVSSATASSFPAYLSRGSPPSSLSSSPLSLQISHNRAPSSRGRTPPLPLPLAFPPRIAAAGRIDPAEVPYRRQELNTGTNRRRRHFTSRNRVTPSKSGRRHLSPDLPPPVAPLQFLGSEHSSLHLLPFPFLAAAPQYPQRRAHVRTTPPPAVLVADGHRGHGRLWRAHRADPYDAADPLSPLPGPATSPLPSTLITMPFSFLSPLFPRSSLYLL